MAGKTTKTGSKSYNIRGGIQAGRDVILGDQQIINTQITTIKTSADFVTELEKIESEIKKIKKNSGIPKPDKQRIAAAQENIRAAILEAQRNKPLGTKIKETLDNAKEIMEKVTGNINVAIGLGAIIGELAQVALRVFGH
jgi:L-ribulose-5-phosphate 3-epimerase UlaE